MSTLTFDVRPTRAYAGLILHRLLVSPVSLVIYFILLGPIVWQAARLGHLDLSLTLLFLIVFGIHIEKEFIKQKLVRDSEPVLSKTNLGCFLAYEIVAHLPGKNNVTLPRLLVAATRTTRAKRIFTMLNTNRRTVLSQLSEAVSAADPLLPFLGEAVLAAREIGEQRIDSSALLYAFFKRGGAFTDLLNQCDVSLSDFKEILHWESYYHQLNLSQAQRRAPGLAGKLGALGRGLVQGYTNELDQITTDISRRSAWQHAKQGLTIHEAELKQALHVLSRASERNLLIIGEPGTGKDTFVANLAATLNQQERRQSSSLTRVLVLNTQLLLSGGTPADQLLLRALQTAEAAGPVLLVVPDLATFLKAAPPNLKTVFTKFLQSRTISIIGLLTPTQYHQSIKTEPALESQMEKITLASTDQDTTLAVLLMQVFNQTKRQRVAVPYRLIKKVYTLTSRYLGAGGCPGKAVAVLNDALALARKTSARELTDKQVQEAVSLKSNVDLTDLDTTEKDRLLNLEDALKTDIIGQEKAITALVHTLKRARLDLHAGKRPLGTFLFLGPTGVGKTHTAKVLAREYFGSVDALIRLDMNEYGHEDSVVGIIGDPSPAAVTDAFLTKQVQDRPFSIILLDEIEKAHPKVLNLFLQILDEGRLADARGAVTDFRNTIIIATSNAGALFIRDFVKQHQDASKADFKDELIDVILKERAFAPEFINRFDEVVLYYPMSIKDAIKVALIMIDDIVQDIAAKKGYLVQVDKDVVVEIVSRGYSIEFGAREMRRTIMEVIENFLADYLLKNEVKRGEVIAVTMADILRQAQDDNPSTSSG